MDRTYFHTNGVGVMSFVSQNSLVMYSKPYDNRMNPTTVFVWEIAQANYFSKIALSSIEKL